MDRRGSHVLQSAVAQRPSTNLWALANSARESATEKGFRSSLHRAGLRFRKQFPVRLPLRTVRVDIAFAAVKVAVFVDGCFWHGCPHHGRKRGPTNAYWSVKLRSNERRDRIVDAALRRAGWRVVRLWEHIPYDEGVARVSAAKVSRTLYRRAAALKRSPSRRMRPRSTVAMPVRSAEK